MIKNSAILALAIFAAGTACSSGRIADQASHAKGAELLLPFKRDLKQALVSGLEEGAVNAISVCKAEAPAIAAALSIDGVKIGRSSHRLRNPANEAPGWVSAILENYLQIDSDRAPTAKVLPNNRVGYAEPITVQPLCLACHGKVLAPEVAARISETYPDDAATGFEEGDLRGLYWVEFPLNMNNRK